MDKIPSWMLKIIAILCAVLLLVLIIDLGYSIRSKYTTVDDKHVVTISAQGKVTAAPDLLIVNTSVVTNASSASDAQNQNTAKMNKVIDFVKTKGVDSKDIETAGYNIYPNYDYKSGTQSVVGYTASQTLSIKVRDLNSVGALLDGVVQNGANQIQSAEYTFSDPDALREQAREQALTSARQKAEKLAAAAGAKLGTLVTFTEEQNNFPTPIPYALNSPALAAGGAPNSLPVTQLEPGTQDITEQVTVTYSLK